MLSLSNVGIYYKTSIKLLPFSFDIILGIGTINRSTKVVTDDAS